MKEDFLHFIWHYQYFDFIDLRTTENQQVIIIDKGYKNMDAGPDFEEVRLLIDSIEWVGSVEVHIKSSDWNVHQHKQDAAYNKVILHLVWQEDKKVLRADKTSIPTVELKDRIPKNLITRYRLLMNNRDVIPCASLFNTATDLQKTLMLDKALSQRLENKAFLVKALLVKNQYDWEESTYQLLAKNFGFKTNSEAFLKLSQSLSLKILLKHKDHLQQIEALLFGQAGFLDDSEITDEYVDWLKKEYVFLAKKYQLEDKKMSKENWKFMRLRPPNFPTIRLAQFAALIHQNQSLFVLFVQSEPKAIKKQMLNCQQSEYWLEHYHFTKKTNNTIPKLGKASLENILINTVVPLLACYAKEKANQDYMDKAVQILDDLKAENNKILRMWAGLGLKVNTAFDSQALIELYNYFCSHKKCLRCVIGDSLMKRA